MVSRCRSCERGEAGRVCAEGGNASPYLARAARRARRLDLGALRGLSSPCIVRLVTHPGRLVGRVQLPDYRLRRRCGCHRPGDGQRLSDQLTPGAHVSGNRLQNLPRCIALCVCYASACCLVHSQRVPHTVPRPCHGVPAYACDDARWNGKPEHDSVVQHSKNAYDFHGVGDMANPGEQHSIRSELVGDSSAVFQSAQRWPARRASERDRWQNQC